MIPSETPPERPVLKRNPGRGGNGKFVPTKEQRDLIKVVLGYGLPQERARLLIRNRLGKPIALETFQRAFKEEILIGTIEMDTIVVTMLATKVRQGDMTAIKWYMANRMKWKDYSHQEKTTTEEHSLVLKIEQADLERRLEQRGLPVQILGGDSPTLELTANGEEEADGLEADRPGDSED